MASLLALAGCSQSTVYIGASADQLHGKPLLLLRPSVLAPTPVELHERIVQRIDAAVAASPEVGTTLDGAALQGRTDLPLAVLDAYSLFSNTLSQAGVPDGELAVQLADSLHVDLLAIAQPAYIPCAVCEQGNQLWLVGQVADAHTGRLVLRVHLRRNISDSDPAALAAEADEMAEEYLSEFALAFHLHPHRQRFTHLKALAAR